MTTYDQFQDSIQEFLGVRLQLRIQDKQILKWLYEFEKLNPGTVAAIKKRCPYRMPYAWKEWFMDEVA